MFFYYVAHKSPNKLYAFKTIIQFANEPFYAHSAHKLIAVVVRLDIGLYKTHGN